MCRRSPPRVLFAVFDVLPAFSFSCGILQVSPFHSLLKAVRLRCMASDSNRKATPYNTPVDDGLAMLKLRAPPRGK